MSRYKYIILEIKVQLFYI